MTESRLAGSFRDPAGHVFLRDGVVHRRITPIGLPSYRALIDSGLYATLVKDQLLVAHDEVGGAVGDRVGAVAPDAGLVVRPEQIPMVSYPYEWSLSQLRDAALVTLRALRTGLKAGLVLKDASAYNVQFLRGRPILIDTLSFEPYTGGPWQAYRQFCQHFFAPLAVAAACDASLVRLESLFIDGLPLGIASRLLPRVSYLRPGHLFHIHLHARAEAKWAGGGDTVRPTSQERPSTRSIEVLAESLQRGIESITWPASSHWAGYYADAESYSAEAAATKSTIVHSWLDRVRPATVWDLGANTGRFSRAAAERGAQAVAFDADTACIETLYRQTRAENIAGVLPLVLDLTSPSPGIGWANRERMSLEERGPADLLLALAVTHHLAIGNNVPLPAIAEYLARLGTRAIVEYVPKSDAMVQRMLRTREDIFTDYTEAAFERAFATHFTIEERAVVAPSERVLYLMTKR